MGSRNWGSRGARLSFGRLVQTPHFHLTPLILIVFGLAGGIFVGMMTAALTEVLNVWPILAKRIGVRGQDCYFCLWHWYLGRYLVHCFIGFILSIIRNETFEVRKGTYQNM